MGERAGNPAAADDAGADGSEGFELGNDGHAKCTVCTVRWCVCVCGLWGGVVSVVCVWGVVCGGGGVGGGGGGGGGETGAGRGRHDGLVHQPSAAKSAIGRRSSARAPRAGNPSLRRPSAGVSTRAPRRSTISRARSTNVPLLACTLRSSHRLSSRPTRTCPPSSIAC